MLSQKKNEIRSIISDYYRRAFGKGPQRIVVTSLNGEARADLYGVLTPLERTALHTKPASATPVNSINGNSPTQTIYMVEALRSHIASGVHDLVGTALSDMLHHHVDITYEQYLEDDHVRIIITPNTIDSGN